MDEAKKSVAYLVWMRKLSKRAESSAGGERESSLKQRHEIAFESASI